ncbi:MAG: tetratricopeptide repeat protein, partial [Anaerolineae bacterium]|nr:tetratricopeptide repeat protein [Anaerolineae bacterium]
DQRAEADNACQPGIGLTEEMNLSNDEIASAYFRLGWLYQGPMEDPAQAIAAYDRAIALAPERALYFYNRGTAYLKANDFERAIADYDQALALDPANDYAVYNRGNAYLRLGQLEQAIADYRQAIALSPDYAKAHNNLCWAGALAGQAEEVSAICDQAVSLADEADLGGVRDSRGVVRAITGDLAGAIEDFEAYIAWLKEYDRYVAGANGREAWLAALKAGQNPFDEDLLEELAGGN